MSSDALNAPQQRKGYFAVSNASDAQLHSYPPPSPNSASSAVSPFRTPPPSRPGSSQGSISDRYHLAADPNEWGADVSRPEPDDALHDPKAGMKGRGNIFTGRGFWNIGCLVIIAVILLGLFLGYPIASHIESASHNVAAAALSTGLPGASSAPANISNWGLIDLDTPQEFHEIYSYHDPTQKMQLVFSDEFETDGRTFYPGDDPYWEAADLHYWSTVDLEWYDPSAVTTRDGALEFTLSKVDDIANNHNMSYKSGMVSSWNKFCFTGGLVLASVSLPGTTDVPGFWPAVWTMGNLGRAGYGATLDGMWPYSYDTCDVGTMPNQTNPDGVTPAAALDTGADGTELSYLPGQRLSRCVCAGESHPGPIHAEDNSYVGRSAPEIDMFEAQLGADNTLGQLSQSAQWAPFDAYYTWSNTSANRIIVDSTLSHENAYKGGIWQEASSAITTTNQDCYQLKNATCFATHGFEYVPGYDDAYISWISDNKLAWTLMASALGANPTTNISARPITQEPLYILANLGFSENFVWNIPFDELTFPAKMRIDWIRVYQPADKINIGCDPVERPTQAYINTYIEAYTNPNLTTWVGDYNQTIPKNKLMGGC